MEFKDRMSGNPGRIKLKNISTGVETTYDVILDDSPTEEGTALNANTLSTLKREILSETQGINEKGDKGETGENGFAGNNIVSVKFIVV